MCKVEESSAKYFSAIGAYASPKKGRTQVSRKVKAP